MKILIYQSLGSEIILNEPMSLTEQHEKYELTDDNFIRNVRGFIRNEQDDILMINDIRYNRRAVPWGKVDKGETFEQALHKEIEEELGVKIISNNYIWWRKAYMRSAKGINAWMSHYYDITISWTPINNESNKVQEIQYLQIKRNNNGKIISVQTKTDIFTDEESIHDTFHGLHILYDVLPYMPKTVEDIESAPFHLPNNIERNKIYQQRYDTERKEYFITEL